MPSLAAPAGNTPSILSLLTPVAASPIAPVDGAAAPSFADIVAGLTAPPELPPTPLPSGQTLPVVRPEIAGAAPAPVNEIDPLLAGCGWSPEALLGSPSVPGLPTPVAGRPIARLDSPSPATPSLAPYQPALPAPAAASPIAGEPEPVTEPDLPTPIRESIRPPVHAALRTSAPEPVIDRAIQPGEEQASTAPGSEEEDAPEPRMQAESELALAFSGTQIVQQPAPTQMAFPPPEPVAATTRSDPAAPVVAPAVDSSRSALSSAPIELQPASTQAPAQGGKDPQPNAQQQPQPKPAPVAAAPIELRIAPEFARQVAQMIQPAVDPTVESQVAPAMPADPLIPVSSAPTPQLVAATPPLHPAAFQSAPVDLGRAGWAEAMIERIAEMPQVDRREAQIKLLPEMLGKVEVTLVERDERVHVTLNAETVQARQLLAEAAPRLQELAEARGLRLGQTEVGGGTPQDRRTPHDQNQPQTPLRPRSAHAEQADNTSNPKGDRIA